jgi:hypothetical protein
MTLEQYEKAQAEKRKALLASVTASTAAAREVSSAGFKNMTTVVKKDAEAELDQYELKSTKDAKAAAPKEEKAKEAKTKEAVAIETGFRVMSEESARNNDRGDFGGRGAGRGGRGAGRGGDFGGRGGGRGGRGGDFGGRGRGGFAGRGAGASSAPARAGGPSFSIEEAAFPTLGK